MVVVRILAEVLSHVLRLPVLGQLDSILGGVCGFLLALVLVWVMLAAAQVFVPMLDASGIRYNRNTPDMTAASSIAASNAGNYDFHLALHSNAAAGAQAGKARGSIVFYYPGSDDGRRAAELIADGLKTIYPDPNRVRTEATTTIGEVA